jgi:hypothetical protein
MTVNGGFEERMTIATLIAAGKLDDRLVDRVLGLLRELDPKAAFRHWIDEGDAADLRFAGKGRDARWALDGLEGVDIVVQPEEPRWRRLLVADMDSTMITVECIDELADYAGLKAEVAAVTERAMRGEIGFEAALAERFNTPVEKFDPFKKIAFEPHKLGIDDGEGVGPAAAVAVGLALRRVGDR